MKYVQITNETFTETMHTSIIQVFYIVSYELERLEKEMKSLKKGIQ